MRRLPTSSSRKRRSRFRLEGQGDPSVRRDDGEVSYLVIASGAKQSSAASETLDCRIPRIKSGVLAMTGKGDSSIRWNDERVEPA
jgi:hypothetical protein